MISSSSFFFTGKEIGPERLDDLSTVTQPGPMAESGISFLSPSFLLCYRKEYQSDKSHRKGNFLGLKNDLSI